jgi:hypothetical protein
MIKPRRMIWMTHVLRGRRCIKIRSEIEMERDYLKDFDEDGRLIPERIFKMWKERDPEPSITLVARASSY